jgi:hypothetical protein
MRWLYREKKPAYKRNRKRLVVQAMDFLTQTKVIHETITDQIKAYRKRRNRYWRW